MIFKISDEVRDEIVNVVDEAWWENEFGYAARKQGRQRSRDALIENVAEQIGQWYRDNYPYRNYDCVHDAIVAEVTEQINALQ